jgi:hypothetical protein
MNHRNIFYSTFIVVILMLLAGCSSSVDQQATPILLFPDQHGWDLAKISISDAETSLDFKRMNCVWVVGEDNKPSDEPKVTALAEKLVTMVPQGPIAIEPQRYNDFKIGDNSFTRRVTLTFKDKSSYTMLIGVPAITRPIYLRFADRYQVYKVDEPIFRQINLDRESWLAPEES